jgi:hypothetical protein
MESPAETIIQLRDKHRRIDIRILQTGKRVTWRGIRCTVKGVHLVWLAAHSLSWTTSYYVMQDSSSTFNVSLIECHLG